MEQTLQYISKTLLQHDVTDAGPGLLYGNMGIAVFFFHYARFTGNQSYRDHAVVLTNRCIKNQTWPQCSINYSNGLAGIGAGVEYLAQNGYIKADTNKALKGFDQCIFFSAVYGDRSDASLYTGLAGLGRYSLFRIAGQGANDDHIGILNNKMLLIHITDIFERIYPALNGMTCTDVASFLYAVEQANIYPSKVKWLLKRFEAGSSSFHQKVKQAEQNTEAMYCGKYRQLQYAMQRNIQPDIIPGLYGGLAGAGLYLLSKMDKQHESWKQLL